MYLGRGIFINGDYMYWLNSSVLVLQTTPAFIGHIHPSTIPPRRVPPWWFLEWRLVL